MPGKTTENVIKIINAGGNVVVPSEDKTTDNLVRIAEEAKKLGVSLTVTGVASKTTDNLVRIAQTYPKGVTFVLD